MAVTDFNPIDDQEQQLVNKLPEEERLAQLKEMSATDQADSTFTERSSKPETTVPQGRFEGNYKGASSSVDLSDKANVNKMWEEVGSYTQTMNKTFDLMNEGGIDVNLFEVSEGEEYFILCPQCYTNFRGRIF